MLFTGHSVCPGGVVASLRAHLVHAFLSVRSAVGHSRQGHHPADLGAEDSLPLLQGHAQPVHFGRWRQRLAHELVRERHLGSDGK